MKKTWMLKHVDCDLIRRVKAVAALEDRTISQVVQDAISLYLSRREQSVQK